MTDQQAQSLSALMDGEADELELRRLLKQAGEGGELREKWSRYHEASAAMSGEVSGFASIDISSRVSALIDEEPVFQQQTPRTPRAVPAWMRPIGGVAVAATVMAAVLVGVRTYNTQLAPQPETIAEAVPMVETEVDAEPGVELPAITLQRGGQTYASFGPQLRVAEPATQQVRTQPVREPSAYVHQRMNYYIEQHARHAALNSNQGMIPFARVSEYEKEAPEADAQ